jgi:hypothetical protein
MLIDFYGDTLISDPADPYNQKDAGGAVNLPVKAQFTVNGAVRVWSGPIVAGTSRQANGIVFGAGKSDGVGAFGFDCGISSLAANNLTFYNTGVPIGSVTGNVWSKVGGGTWAVLSDIRTKKDITPFAPNTDAVLALEVINYRHNGLGGSIDDGKLYTGLSAQATRELFPAWVVETRETIDDSPVLQIDTSPLIYELLAIVKSHEATIKSHEATTKSQDARITALEAKLAA